ncbi:MAG: hypothetical protein OZ934_15325 [Anaerolineae bacterium]|nr:hypothetical protein [Anaerolineae bacterium]
MNRRRAVGAVIGLVAGLLSGCGLLQDVPPTVTPIYITATPEPVIVPIVATETPAATPVLAETSAALLPTRGPERTATFTPPPPITQTPTFTPTATDTPVTPGPVVYAPVGGVAGAGGAGIAIGSGSGSSGGTGCASVPGGALGALYQSDPSIAVAIGCPLAGAPNAVDSAYQPFQNGLMVWVAAPGQSLIYALYGNGTYQRFNDTFLEGVDPSSGGAIPPPGLLEPVRGFGKVWRENPSARDTLGWALTGESGGTAEILLFERGEMLRVPQSGQTYILITGAPGTWSARAG